MIVAEEDVELPHGPLPGSLARDECLILAPLVEVGQEPIVEREGLGSGTGFEPAGRGGNQGAAGLATAWPMVVPSASSR